MTTTTTFATLSPSSATREELQVVGLVRDRLLGPAIPLGDISAESGFGPADSQ